MSGYYIKLGDTLRVAFGTSATDGAAADAASTPVVTVYEQGTATGYSPTVSNLDTGLYEVAIVCSGGNGFEVGKEYSAAVEATVGDLVGRDGIASFQIAANDIDDVVTSVDAVGDMIDALPAAVADAVWDEDRGDHDIAGTFGERVNTVTRWTSA